jgi:hypothetical protein
MSIPGHHGHLKAMRLLPFAAAAAKTRLTLMRQVDTVALCLRLPPVRSQAPIGGSWTVTFTGMQPLTPTWNRRLSASA